jgi:hypothetical protein
MTALPNVQEFRWAVDAPHDGYEQADPTVLCHHDAHAMPMIRPLGTYSCADDLVLDDIGVWVAELLKEMQLIRKLYDLSERGFWVGSKFVTVGEVA